jgi:hypothetical protein
MSSTNISYPYFAQRKSCIRRFWGCDKGTAKQFPQPQKCGGEKTHKGRSPTGFFRSPSPVGAKRIQSCYVQFGRFIYPILLYSIFLF